MVRDVNTDAYGDAYAGSKVSIFWEYGLTFRS